MIPFSIAAIHTIELVGSYTARHVQSGHEVDLTSRRNRKTTRGPISPLCRKLIAEGIDPSAKVQVIRKALDSDGHIPIFKRDRSLQTWADADCMESERRSLHLVGHRPFPVAVKAHNGRQGSPEGDRAGALDEGDNSLRP